MVALLSISGNILPSISNLIAAYVRFQEATIAFERMFEFSNVSPEWKETNEPDEQRSLVWTSLRVNHITFGFPGRAKLLKDVCFEVRKGEMISILGESGSGKSTILQILQRFYFTQSGKILINDLPADQISTPIWRNLIGVVSQDVKIFTGTILHNICLSDTEMDLYKVIELSKRLGLHKFFERLPQQYLTLIGEEGINLSGGQKQLVAIARALYNNPQLLLLDEATSGMDMETENLIMSVLQALKSNIGIIMITHRLKTARKSDKIYILENGIITHSGHHSVLLQTANFYSKAFAELNTA